MGLVVDRVLSFVDTEQSPFTARRLVSGPSCAMGALAHVELRVRRFAGFISTASTSEFYGALAKMTTLSLAKNKIGDVGCTAFAEACAKGALAQLNDLYLYGNPISEQAKGTMRTAMSKSGGSVHF